MAGWDATPSTSRFGSFYGIHHPRGDTKKVSHYTGNLDLVRLTDISLGLNFWRIKKWNKGGKKRITELSKNKIIS